MFVLSLASCAIVEEYPVPNATIYMISKNQDSLVYHVEWTDQPDTFFHMPVSIERSVQNAIAIKSKSKFDGHTTSWVGPRYFCVVYLKQEDCYRAGANEAIDNILHSIADGDWSQFIRESYPITDEEVEQTEEMLLEYIKYFQSSWN